MRWIPLSLILVVACRSGTTVSMSDPVVQPGGAPAPVPIRGPSYSLGQLSIGVTRNRPALLAAVDSVVRAWGFRVREVNVDRSELLTEWLYSKGEKFAPGTGVQSDTGAVVALRLEVAPMEMGEFVVRGYHRLSPTESRKDGERIARDGFEDVRKALQEAVRGIAATAARTRAP